MPVHSTGLPSQARRAADLCPQADLPPMLCRYGFPGGGPRSVGTLMFCGVNLSNERQKTADGEGLADKLSNSILMGYSET